MQASVDVGREDLTEITVPGVPSGIRVHQVSTPGLGDHSYVVSAATAAAVIDPQRDLDRYEAGLGRLGLRMTMVAETHVHNDYVSGGRALAVRHGAVHVLPADAGYQFEHHAVADGDETSLGDLVVRAVRTPGHTPHHTSYLVLAGGEPVLLLSGGCVLVGACGRTDLIAPDVTEQLTRQQYRSATRLLALPMSTIVAPTHGQGSFCTASSAGGDTYTDVGLERTRNPAALAAGEDDFVASQLGGLLAYPAYYAQMAGLNLVGADAWHPGPLPALSVSDAASRQGGGTVLVDGRPRRDFAESHVPGSVNIEFDDSFATYLGWLFPFGTRVVLVAGDDGALPADPVRQAARIGVETIDGRLDGGLRAWAASGAEVGRYEVTDVDGLRRAADAGDALILDVRQEAEWSAGHVPGAWHIHLPDLPGRLQELPVDDRPVYVMCRSGHRASIAASLLDGAGVPTVLVDGGFPDWADRGYPVEH